MKVMLVRPKPHKNSLGLTDLMTCEPIELEYVATLCKQLGHEVIIEDMILEKKPLDALFGRLCRESSCLRHTLRM
jgi:hypothetical protein